MRFLSEVGVNVYEPTSLEVDVLSIGSLPDIISVTKALSSKVFVNAPIWSNEEA